MKESFAIQEGLGINRSEITRVKLSRNHNVTTTGTVEAGFRFDGEPELYALTFHLLPTCIHDVILGKSFLKLTETFSERGNFTRRVKQRILRGLSHFHLLYLGESAPKFTGLLNGRPREALGDWGSNALIMDEDFARKQGLPLSTGPEHVHTVYLADNTNIQTSGMVLGVRWEFGLGGSGKEHDLDFHVMKHAPADVILSDDFLNETSAFIEYDCYLVDEDDEDDESEAYFFGIKIDLKNHVPVSASEQMAEEARRDAEDDRIDNLPRHHRQEARQQEDERRSAWDVQHISATAEIDGSSTLDSTSITPSIPSQGTTLNNSSVTLSSLDTSSDAPSGIAPSGKLTPGNAPPGVRPPANLPVGHAHPATAFVQASAVPPEGLLLKKGSKWRFKLKRKTSRRT